MAYWVEIHCDTPHDEAPAHPKRSWERVCANMDHDYPSTKVATLKVASSVVNELAKLQGWSRTRERGWQCPGCLKYRTKEGECHADQVD